MRYKGNIVKKDKNNISYYKPRIIPNIPIKDTDIFVYNSYDSILVSSTSYMIFEINHDMVTLIDVFFNLAVPLNQVSSHPSTYHCPDCF